MSTQRFKALELIESRQSVSVTLPTQKVSEYFGENTFDLNTMKQMVSSDVFDNLTNAIQKGEKIDNYIADAVASAMKTWAIAKGATHYTHWFQPLTGTTAEKHDAFFEVTPSGEKLEQFRGNALIQQEPDASSFPSGGLRQTFEARGYTAWDPTSPSFLMENDGSKTLCIPTIFVSFTGEALDNKSPLLKSIERIDHAATEVCQYFDKTVTKVTATLGCEQEFFLIDKAIADARPDLVLTGRTLFGRTPPKGQQLDDHYFGSIPPRVQKFLQELEIEAYKLGIPITTRHNEVAPSQYEVAPVFEDVNIANDHNLLLMDIMEKVARKHYFKVLFHEKPFAELNGSGKHNNWSLMTNEGRNLLSPSSRARQNLQFLTFFVNTLKAVQEHADLLRASIASPSNEYRLGAKEAPPVIISAFIGSRLTAVLDELEHNGDIKVDKGDNVYMKLGIDKIPAILLDNTDRNRTSPFAFTGNKFEFRAVGSSANTAQPMTVLNTIVAKQLEEFKKRVDRLLAKDIKKEVAIINILREYIKGAKKIIFDGNGYGDEWMKEASRRGLPNVSSTPKALDAFISKKTIKLYHDMGIMSASELEARHEVMLENFTMKLQIEARVMSDLAKNHILPTAIKYQNELITNVKGLKEIGLYDETKEIITSIKVISNHISEVKRICQEMKQKRKQINTLEDPRAKAIAYCEQVKDKYFSDLRWHCDKLETMIDDNLWPLPKYREMLFLG